jgi:hypothetical protein
MLLDLFDFGQSAPATPPVVQSGATFYRVGAGESGGGAPTFFRPAQIETYAYPVSARVTRGTIALTGHFPSSVYHVQRFVHETVGETEIGGSFAVTWHPQPRTRAEWATSGALTLAGSSRSAAWSNTKFAIAVDDAVILGDSLAQAEDRVRREFELALTLATWEPTISE